jgi:hypothetical protein
MDDVIKDENYYAQLDEQITNGDLSSFELVDADSKDVLQARIIALNTLRLMHEREARQYKKEQMVLEKIAAVV